MNLKCTINGKEYNIVQGVTFSKEYNETLDSASIIIDQVPKIDDLKPFDDVFIYDGTFNGYTNKNTKIQAFKPRNDFETYCVFLPKEIENYASVQSDKQNIVFRFYTSSEIIGIAYCKIELVGGELRLVDTSSNKYNVLQLVGNEYRLYYGTSSDITLAFRNQTGAYFESFEFVVPHTIQMPNFYRHLLIDQYSEERLNPEENLYKYKIELFSETKKLETIQLPNISITQPLKIEKKKSVYEYMQQFVEMYNVKIKRSKGNGLWYYDNKYVLDDDLEDVFGDVYCPDFSLNNPSLRDLLNQLCLVKDRIVVVNDDVISSFDITQRKGSFSTDNVTQITGSMSSDNYANNLKRTYNNALSGRNTARRVEFLGFRNSSEALMTIGNMRLETKYPIYKINRVLMCYYKKALVTGATNVHETRDYNVSVASAMPNGVTYTITLKGVITSYNVTIDNNNITYTTSNTYNSATKVSTLTVNFRTSFTGAKGYAVVSYVYDHATYDKVFLCKQDITPLIKLEQEKQTLSKDWNDFNQNEPSGIGVIEEMAQYKLCTLSYSIGSNLITGWGTTYQYPIGWWTITKSYLENIFKIIDKNIEYGIYSYGYLAKELEQGEYISNVYGSDPLDSLFTTFTGSARLKSFFFEVDYEAFYNGTVITSKDSMYDDVTINDNSQSSLTLLEKDGLFQKEKINRFGNKALTIEAIYDNLDEVQELGTVYDDDNIIYHVDYQIWGNYVKATYYATKDYVLKNYFTSVYAKHRPFSLLDYDQSINRADNKKIFIELSKDKLVYEEANDVQFNNFTGFSYIDDILSFVRETQHPESIDKFNFPEKINYGIVYYDENIYASDINAFVCGYSLCFNISMFDNISMGNYIKVAKPTINSVVQPTNDDYTGSVQDFYLTVDDVDTGFVEEMGLYVCHIPEKENFNDIVLDMPSDVDTLYAPLFALPKLNINSNVTNIIGNMSKVNKDNKEVIDFTYQIEPFTNDKDVLFSEWMLKLSDLYGTYVKTNEEYTIKDISGVVNTADMFFGTAKSSTGSDNNLTVLLLKINRTIYNNLINGTPANVTYAYANEDWDWTSIMNWYSDAVVGWSLNISSIKEKTSTYIVFNAVCFKRIKHGLWGGYSDEGYETEIKLYLVDKLGLNYFSNDVENYYFSNLETTGTGLNTILSPLPYTNVGYGQFSNGKTFRPLDDFIDDRNTDSRLLNISNLNGLEKTYYKNMFIATDTNNLKKTLVYDEYAMENFPYTILQNNPSDVIFSSEDESGAVNQTLRPTYIKIDLTNINSNIRSIHLWYNNENTLHFVFGVNLTAQDFTRGYVKIYCSAISKKDIRVYDVNNKVIGEIKNYTDETQNYGILQEYVVKS